MLLGKGSRPSIFERLTQLTMKKREMDMPSDKGGKKIAPDPV